MHVFPDQFYDGIVNSVDGIDAPDEVQVLIVAGAIEEEHGVADGGE